MLDIDLVMRGDLPPYTRWYATGRLRPALRHSPAPLQRARVELRRSEGAGVRRAVVAQADLDVGGRMVQASAEGISARQAVDRLHARLRLILPRLARQSGGAA